jgi:hypothetical protein
MSVLVKRYQSRLMRLLVKATVLALLVVATGPVAGAIAGSPVASLTWFPANPHTGEPVALASTSTDATSPIVGVAWDLAGNGVFEEVGPVTSTSFSAPGSHTVRLRVTAADGSSSIAAAAIQVSAPPVGVLLPIPVVRIVGSVSALGFKLRLLSVETPPGARITVSCRGRGCPLSAESRIAPSTSVGTVTLRFRRFERALPAGVILEVRVSKIRQIGEYTRLEFRHHRPPARLDECLDPAGIIPVACPADTREG